ncbi:MAG: cupin domain-containing protein [Candidatus Moraniibacteriota bacterium]|nr:MAG: cupin domain-containing protein [Candidatus Moranbacteria bacterium]
MKKGYSVNLEQDTLENENFRKVLFTANHMQLVLMTVPSGQDIGLETHQDHDQFIRIEAGEGKAIISGEEFLLQDGSAVIIPSGNEHNIINTGKDPLRLYTVYSPAEHSDGTIHVTKAEAEEYEKKHHE